MDAPREKVFRAWAEPALVKQWFAALPWTTPVVEVDVRVGGSSLIVMRGPDGSEFPNLGVYLEVVKKRTPRVHGRFYEGVTCYRFVGGIKLIGAANLACATGSTARCLTSMLAG